MHAEKFTTHPEVRAALDQIIAKLSEEQKNIVGVRPASKKQQAHNERLVKRCGDLRGAGLYYPYIGSGIGKGPLVELEDGSVKYDFITGIGVHFFGHSHLPLVRANLEAGMSDLVMQGNLQQNQITNELLAKIRKAAVAGGAKVKNVFLSTSGAMANENALKMILQKNAPASRILAFEHCFSGRTVALAQVTDKAAYRDGLPQALAVDYLPFFNAKAPKTSIQKALSKLDEHLTRYPGQHAGMIFELVQGEGGYYEGDKRFFLEIIKKLKAKGIAVWIDEIQTFGRTPQIFAFQHYGLDEHIDVVTIGKMTQICATLYADTYKPRPGLVSQTFTSSSSAIHSANAIFEELVSSRLYGPRGKVVKTHAYFVKHMRRLARKFKGSVSGPFGFGGMWAFTYKDGSPAQAKKLLGALYEAGLMAFMAGSAPMRIRFLPPLPVIDYSDIDAAMDILERVMGKLEKKR